jgi:NADH dehydrogenase [ubiquinone] 1 alpha subcomplex assembly factor 5
MNIFDRNLKQRQRNRSITIKHSEYYDYLRIEVAERLVDRLKDITRVLPIALELGCHRGHILKILEREAEQLEMDNKNDNMDNSASNSYTISGINTLVQCDFSSSIPSTSSYQKSNKYIEAHQLIVDEENLPFESKSFDLVISSMALHWVNDLPSTLLQIKGKEFDLELIYCLSYN